jgi:hypothetical protein
MAVVNTVMTLQITPNAENQLLVEVINVFSRKIRMLGQETCG